MSFHITVTTVIQTAMTKGGTDKISTPPTWSNDHRFSSNFLNYHIYSDLGLRAPFTILPNIGLTIAYTS